MFPAGEGFGPYSAVTDMVVRLEPYARVTFLLDYRGVVPALLDDAPHNQIFLRGYVAVAGRTKRPQKSSWRRRWRLGHETHTAIDGAPAFTPLAMLWRELYLHLPERNDADAGTVSREMANYVLDEAMSRFNERPTLDELRAAVDEVTQRYGGPVPMLGACLLAGYEALDRLEGRLTAWTEGLFFSQDSQRLFGEDRVGPG